MVIGTIIFNSGEFGIFTAVLLADIGQVMIMMVLLNRNLASRIRINEVVAQG